MKLFFRGLFATVAATLALSASAFGVGGENAGEAATASTVEVTYDIYVGGIPIGELAVALRFQGNGYTANSTLRTAGIANALWAARIEASSNGTLTPERPDPTLYYALSAHGGHTQQVTVNYSGGGPASIHAEPQYGDWDRIQIADDKKKQTVDPVSAMVSFATAAAARQERFCGFTLPVFDARRRYDVSLSHVRSTTVKMDSGLYAGPVQVCKIGYRPIAGARQLVIDGKFPDVYAWVTSIQSPTEPDRRYLLPLRIWAENDYAVGVALASEVKLDGKVWRKPR